MRYCIDIPTEGRIGGQRRFAWVFWPGSSMDYVDICCASKFAPSGTGDYEPSIEGTRKYFYFTALQDVMR